LWAIVPRTASREYRVCASTTREAHQSACSAVIRAARRCSSSNERFKGGRAVFGERKKLVESDDWTGPAFEQCAQAAVVCRVFDQKTLFRNKVLSFQHHKVLASLKLKPALIEELLDWCEAPLKNEA
jgi:hypothetical protein